jgi:hypothetical protein
VVPRLRLHVLSGRALALLGNAVAANERELLIDPPRSTWKSSYLVWQSARIKPHSRAPHERRKAIVKRLPGLFCGVFRCKSENLTDECEMCISLIKAYSTAQRTL